MNIVSLYDTNGTKGAVLGFKDAATLKAFEDAFKDPTKQIYNHTETAIGGTVHERVFNLANYGYYVVVK